MRPGLSASPASPSASPEPAKFAEPARASWAEAPRPIRAPRGARSARRASSMLVRLASARVFPRSPGTQGVGAPACLRRAAFGRAFNLRSARSPASCDRSGHGNSPGEGSCPPAPRIRPPESCAAGFAPCAVPDARSATVPGVRSSTLTSGSPALDASTHAEPRLTSPRPRGLHRLFPLFPQPTRFTPPTSRSPGHYLPLSLLQPLLLENSPVPCFPAAGPSNALPLYVLPPRPPNPPLFPVVGSGWSGRWNPWRSGSATLGASGGKPAKFLGIRSKL